jgi:gas vesicle protein
MKYLIIIIGISIVIGTALYWENNKQECDRLNRQAAQTARDTKETWKRFVEENKERNRKQTEDLDAKLKALDDAHRISQN